MDTAQNQLIVEGVLLRDPERRNTPAGIPISRFTLEHCSRRKEAGLLREVRYRIMVTANGKDVQPALDKLSKGSSVKVTGFLSRASFRSGNAQLMLHAELIEHLDR